MSGYRCIALAQTFAVQLHKPRAVDLCIFAAVPVDGHITQCLFGSPPVVSHHRHKLAHVQHFDDATAVVYFAAVQAEHFATKNRRLRNGRVQHAGQLGIHTEANLAGHDVVHVHPRDGLASHGPSGGVFQRHILGGCQLGGVGCELTVAQGLFAGCVHHFAQHGLAFALRDAPTLGRSLHQHHASRGAGFA